MNINHTRIILSNIFIRNQLLILQKALTYATFRQNVLSRIHSTEANASTDLQMKEINDLTYADINWQHLWLNSRKRKGWASKGPEEWDKKSESFASRNKSSRYIDILLPHIPLGPDITVLDIGSGPGTLALPMAEKTGAVTALDFSPRMLSILRHEARRQNIGNISTIECAWEDNWYEKGVTPHDIAIASRSMNVDNIVSAIEKLNTFSTKYVFITDRISPTPFDPQLFAALGRTFHSGPDYIYTLNILYSMGIHPNVTILELEKNLQFADIDQAMLSYSWMIKDISSDEERLLKRYLQDNSTETANGEILIQRVPPPRWALIWWSKNSL